MKTNESKGEAAEKVPKSTIPDLGVEPPAEGSSSQASASSSSSSSSASLLAPRCFKQLVFEGGGVKGIAYVGALEILEERGHLTKINHVAGTSAGAITALLLGLGYNSEAIKPLLNMDFTTFKDGSFLKTKNIYDLTNHYGVHPGQAFYEWAKAQIVTATGNPYTTFEELHQLCLTSAAGQRHYRELSMVGVNVSKGTYEVFSYQTTPTLALVDALRISMSIPVFFQPIRAKKDNNGVFITDPNTHQLCHTHQGDYYVDGGLLNNFALKLFDKDGQPNPETLGFRVDSAVEIAQLRDGQEPASQSFSNIIQYLTAVVNTGISGQNYVQLSQDDQQRTIYIDTLDVGMTDFHLSPDKIEQLIQSGREATELYLQQKAYQPLSSAVKAERLAVYEQKQLYRKADSIYGSYLSGGAFQGQATGSFIQFIFLQTRKTTAEKGMERLVTHPGVETVRLAEYQHNTHWVLQVTGDNTLWQRCQAWLNKYQLTEKCIDSALAPSRLAIVAEWTATPDIHQHRLGHLRRLDKALLEAAYQGKLAEVECYLHQGARYDYREPRSGDTPLHRAAESGRGDVVAALLGHGSYVNSRNLFGNTPLILAAFEGQTAMVGQLITAGADIEAINHFGARPLHRAARMGHQATLDLLLQHGADPTATDYDGFTPAAIAQRYGQLVTLPENPNPASSSAALSSLFLTPVEPSTTTTSQSSTSPAMK